jgi:hypothetical protein
MTPFTPLETVAPQCPGFLAPADVLAAYCTVTRVPLHELTGPSKMREVSRLRQDCIWLLRDLTSAGSTQIGALLGGRHYSTIEEAAAVVADRLAAEPEYRIRLRQTRAEIVAWIGAAPGLPSPVRITAALGVLQDTSLTDADARATALTLLGGRNAA